MAAKQHWVVFGHHKQCGSLPITLSRPFQEPGWVYGGRVRSKKLVFALRTMLSCYGRGSEVRTRVLVLVSGFFHLR